MASHDPVCRASMGSESRLFKLFPTHMVYTETFKMCPNDDEFKRTFKSGMTDDKQVTMTTHNSNLFSHHPVLVLLDH